MNLVIREAAQKDLAQLCALMTELTGHAVTAAEMQNRLDMVTNSPIDDLYVCEVDGKVQGVLGFRIRENLEEASRYGEISIIVTHSQARRTRLGRALMEFAENLAKQHGCKGTWLVSGFGREEEAHTFYKKLGYAITGYRFVKPFA